MSTVILILIDGARPDAFSIARCPNIQALIARGSSSLHARTVMPCLTLPCHTSLFYSVPPLRHGILSNEWILFAQQLPGLFDRLHAAKLKAAFLYNWEPLRDLSQPGSLAFSYFRDKATTPDGDQVVADQAAHTLTHDRLDFAFVYLGTLDNVGHSRGWLSDEYLRQLERVDHAVGTVLSAIGSTGAVIVHSDHGGHDDEHGTDAPEDMTIPWLAAGPGIQRRQAIARSVSLLDTAPTIACLLNAPQPRAWQGHCVDEILSARSKQRQLTLPQPAFALMADRFWGEF